MIHFAKTTPPTIPRRPYILWLARALAGVIFAMFVVQLIKLPELVDKYNAFVVWVILCGELLALPFLLNLPLSKAFRWVSWGMGWMMCFGGISLVYMAIRMMTGLDDDLCYAPCPVGSDPRVRWQPPALCNPLWPSLVMTGFFIIFVWISWAMWPGSRAKWRRKAVVTAIMIVVSWMVWFGINLLLVIFLPAQS